MQTSSTANLAVLVLVHGGGFAGGASNDYAEEDVVLNLVSRGIVVVTLNYRLGLFGFMLSDDAQLSGNYGIMDIVTVSAFEPFGWS